MWNRLPENISFARVYFREAAIIWALSVVPAAFIFGVSFRGLLLLIFFSGLIMILFLDLLGKKRRREIEKIKNIVTGIRNNRYGSPDEIKLGKELVEIEGDIKGMFLRTQNDIANLKKLELMRTEFLGNVSHELRTPIFAIQGYLETLLEGALENPKVNRSFTQKAMHHTHNLNNLLNDLIDISMIESGQMRMSFRYFNINEYVGEIIDEFRPLAEEKGLRLDFEPANSNKLQLFGDKKRLRQVFTNLISNAIKYTEEGKVTVAVTEEQGYGKIIISDTGIGIPEEDTGRIFERFYRVDKDRSRAVGGTGLGLAIVKHILEAHGTRAEVKSEWGKGSEFSFKLKK